MDKSDGPGTCANALSLYRDVLNAQDNTKITGNRGQNTRMLRKKLKWPNLCASAVRQAPGKSNGLRDHADRSNMFTDA